MAGARMAGDPDTNVTFATGDGGERLVIEREGQ